MEGVFRLLPSSTTIDRGFRHDLRHTVITELAELGVAERVLESISGHLSRRMLEHYSHIRIDAKRQALDALDEARRGAESNGGVRENGRHPDGYALKPRPNGAAVPLVVALAGLASPSRHSLHLAGSPPSAKLLMPLARRDVRVV